MIQYENRMKGSLTESGEKIDIIYSKSTASSTVPNTGICSIKALEGIWRFDTLEIPSVGIRRKEKGNDYYFEFSIDGNVVAHVNGNVFQTCYIVRDGYVFFDQEELAAMKLEIGQGKLKMKKYLGATLVFSKEDGRE